MRRTPPAAALLALAALLGGCNTLVAQNPASPLQPVNAVRHGDDARLMLRGYDVVGYFTLGQAQPGLPSHRLEADGVVYLFANAENLERFRSAPAQYQVAYHGFDAMRMVFAIPDAADPAVWLQCEGRVFFFADAASKAAFELDPGGHIALADGYWRDEVVGHNSAWQALWRRVDRVPHYRSRDDLALEVAQAQGKPR